MKIYIEINNFIVNLNKEEIEKILSSIDNIKHKWRKYWVAKFCRPKGFDNSMSKKTLA
jgi:hypothetical protein